MVTKSARPANFVRSAPNSARLAMKGGQVHEPKLRTRGLPVLAKESRGADDLSVRFTRLGFGEMSPS